MLNLIKNKYRESIGVRVIEYEFNNYLISIEIDMVQNNVPIITISNKKIKELTLTKSIGESTCFKIDCFISSDLSEISDLLQEINDAKKLIPILNNNMGKLMNPKGE